MSKQISKNEMDERPITAITVIEDIFKCPPEFSVITKTYDTDLDADLWKDNGFFTKKVTRYLCVSKEKSIIDYVLEKLVIVNEKEFPPVGFGSVSKTTDSDQKAWRKKQLCFKLSRRSMCFTVITDIILLNKSRKAPDGYHMVGDLNGLLLCVKLRPAVTNSDIVPNVSNGNGLTAENGHNGNHIKLDNEAHYYEKLIMKPVRPAPAAPNTSTSDNSSYHGLQGLPFILNSRLESTMTTLLATLPEVTIKTKEDIEKEYSYDFQTEKQLCLY